MAQLIVNFGFDTMVPETKDRLIAPRISELSTPRIPDISASRKYPLNAFIENTDLSLVLPNLMRQACFNFLRNVEAAFDEYCDARIALFEYLRLRDRTVTPYFSSLRCFEHCLAHLYHGVVSVNVFGKEKQFEHDDGSVLDRVLTLHNHVKHMDKEYKRVAIRDEISFKLFATRDDGSTNISYGVGDVSNVPIWLTNQGLECLKTSLTYSELADEVLSALDEPCDVAVLQPKNLKRSASQP